MDVFKVFKATVISGLMAYLEPVYNPMTVLMFVFIPNMIFGLVADLFIKNNRFIPKKFIFAFFYVAIYLSIVASIYIIGERIGDVEESLFFVKMTIYVFVYFYITNSLRNLTIIFPKNKPIAFLYFAVGLEFTKRIPALSEFLKRDKTDNDNLNSV